MPGGTGMYIHNYQIHNVLNAYRKQLSQNPAKGSAKRPPHTASGPTDMVALSAQGQQPAIVNKISAEIVDRIAQSGPQNQFDHAVAKHLNEPPSDRPMETGYPGIEFAYTLIDEQNRKSTHKFPIRALDAPDKPVASQGQSSIDGTRSLKQPTQALPNDNQEIQLERKG